MIKKIDAYACSVCVFTNLVDKIHSVKYNFNSEL